MKWKILKLLSGLLLLGGIAALAQQGNCRLEFTGLRLKEKPGGRHIEMQLKNAPSTNPDDYSIKYSTNLTDWTAGPTVTSEHLNAVTNGAEQELAMEIPTKHDGVEHSFFRVEAQASTMPGGDTYNWTPMIVNLEANQQDVVTSFIQTTDRAEPNFFELQSTSWGLYGHIHEGMRNGTTYHEMFRTSETFGWRWNKNQTEYEPVLTPKGQAALYQFGLCAVQIGNNLHGNNNGRGHPAPGFPIDIRKTDSFTLKFDLGYTANDNLEGYFQPGEQVFDGLDDPGNGGYARHSLILDLFLTGDKPDGTSSVKSSASEEVLIFLNYNPRYPQSEAATANANGSHLPPGRTYSKTHLVENTVTLSNGDVYHYHSFNPYDQPFGDYATPGDFNSATTVNYHSFRNAAPNAVPKEIDIIPFLKFIRNVTGRNLTIPNPFGAGTLPVKSGRVAADIGPNIGQPNWLGDIKLGTQIYDHTSGEATFNGPIKWTKGVDNGNTITSEMTQSEADALDHP